MKKIPENEFMALIADLRVINGAHTPEEYADTHARTLIHFIANFYHNRPIKEQMLENALRLAAPEPAIPADFILAAAVPQNLEAVVSDAGDGWFVIDEPSADNAATQGYLHELIPQEKLQCLQETPTAAGEIIAFYLFLKSICLNPASHSAVYLGFIKTILSTLTKGSISYLIQNRPQISKDHYHRDCQKALNALSNQQFDDFFKLIDRHLFYLTQVPLEKIDAYINHKLGHKALDAKFIAARAIQAQLYQHTVKCFYQRYPAEESIRAVVYILIQQTQKYLNNPLKAVDGLYQDTMLKILSYMDKLSTEHLLDVTQYRALVSPTNGFESYTNRVAHFSGTTFSTTYANKLQLFNNAAINEFGDQNGAFDQIIQSIETAERFIFILGWEFSPQLTFGPKNQKDTRTLGEILVDKAAANPHMMIAIMVWGQQVMYQNIGAATHADAASYLKKLAWQRHRKPPFKNLILCHANRQWVYLGVNSHHQKLVLTDQKQWPYARAFVGGLDLTAGRFDAKHQLKPIAEYMEYYHQTPHKQQLGKHDNDGWRLTTPDICNMDVGNPFRTPWHDIHCKIEGAAVLDFLNHFQQHWTAHCFKPFKNARIKRAIDETIEQFKKPGHLDHPEECIWAAQLLRSHTRDNCNFWRLQSDFENSILEGYINIIASAERFIYIENQYFIGGGKDVHNEQRFGNLIPNAIFNKIIQKHNQKEPFHVFITLPLFPEGGPESSLDNAVRREQHNTMYWLINELNEHTDNNAHRYISFFWLGEWDGKQIDYDELAQSLHTTRKQLIAASRRYPIYVHSKFIIVDDKRAIIGSANINERSMMGIRDSEIAVLIQPEKGKTQQCQQALYAFRKMVWQQYFGQDCLEALDEEGLHEPHTHLAVKCIQDHARYNLRHYIDNGSARRDTQGHLMAWPYLIREQEECDKEFLAKLEKLPDTPLSEQNNVAYNWILDEAHLDKNHYTSMIEKYFGGHPDLK